jgi:hypothetical protein
MRGSSYGCVQRTAHAAPALAIAYRDLAPLEVHVLDAQPQTLEQAHAGSVEQARREPARAVELSQMKRRTQCRYASSVRRL